MLNSDGGVGGYPHWPTERGMPCVEYIGNMAKWPTSEEIEARLVEISEVRTCP